ncbi:MAG: hypothetical protein R2746_17805 [Acidimicrobiales bacterium]
MDAEELRTKVEQLVARSQEAILDASHRLAEGITKEANRNVPPVAEDVTQMVDDAFDFAQKVIAEQRKLVTEVLRTVGDTLEGAAESATATARKVAGKAPGAKKPKKAPAKKAPAKKAPAKKKAAAKKAPAKKKAGS